MKKIIVFLILLLLVCGCEKKEEMKPLEEEKEEVPVEEVVEEVPTYQDDNNTPISFYQLKGGELHKLTTVSGRFASLDDIGLFQIYPSNEENINLSNGFPTGYYDEFIKYQSSYHGKVGFSISFTLKNGEEIHYNILTPSQTMDQWEYLLTYLYDDYHNMGKSFYSHIEPEEYTDDTLFTAIKLQLSGNFEEINSPILLTVYTYNSEDDFENNHYRGNSQSTLTICINDLC